jgi:glycosyltransferase involved in cell wall biosynthesis
MRILQVYNSAAHYRESVFLLIDEHYDCDYVFGRQFGDIKQMDTSKLHGRVMITENKFLGRHFYWQPGVQDFLRRDYDAFLLLGDTHCLSTWIFCFRAYLLGLRNKVYFWTHGWYGKETRIERLLKKVFFHFAGGGIFLYGNYARGLMINEGFSPQKLYVIHNSLAYNEQIRLRNNLVLKPIFQNHFNNNDKNLIFVGRLTKVKHLDLVLDAMRFLREKGKSYNFTLIGGGVMLEALREHTFELGLEDHVWFYGPCYDEIVLSSLIYNADLCVSPGNVGLTAMHVMVFGTPVLTHNDYAWQMPEFEAIKEGATGLFFEKGNAYDLAESIDKWFGTKDYDRDRVRHSCFDEIDSQWTPVFQLNVLKENLK